MSDEMKRAGAEPMPGTDQGKKGFLSTAKNKTIALVVGLAVLAIVVGVVAAVVVGALDEKDDDLGLDPRERGSETKQTQTRETSGTPQVPQPVGEELLVAKDPAPPVTNDQVFTFRDIFRPLLRPLVTTDTTVTPTPDTVTPTTPDTLYLQNVVTEDGVLKAVLLLNGQTYTLAAGEVISGTPWQVLSVSSTSVTMLYGDTQVTLTVGQGITK